MTEQMLWTACISPFNEDGRQVDYESLEACLRLQATCGNGILLLGSTGEGLSLSLEEKQEIIRFACSLNAGTQILVGIAGHSLQEALFLLDFCKDLPIHGHLMTTPVYAKPGAVGQTKWFERLLNASAHPAMLYNIPGRAAIELHTEAVKNLQGHENFVAIKDSGGSLERLVAYQTVAPHIAVFCGDDHLMPAMAAEGSVGLVSVAANVWPAATRRYVSHILGGGRIAEKTWWRAIRALFSASNPIGVKALMRDIKMIVHDTVRLPLSMEDLPCRDVLLDCHRAIHDWEATA